MEGLSSSEAKALLEKYGYNELKETKKKSVVVKFLEQFRDIPVLILIVALVISALLGETIDAIAIGIIVILNATLGFVQEYRAERALEALKKMAAPKARVYRDGELIEIEAREIVVGDIVALEAGNVVPADVEVMESFRLQVDEAPLTGESAPVNKDAGEKAFMGCTIPNGRAKGKVIATGMSTEFGKIAKLVQSAEEVKTPLQMQLDRFGKQLAYLIIGVIIVVFFAGLLRNIEPFEMFFIAITLAVAAIPEGLPAVVTITLAIGVQQMAKRNALVRKLKAVETLGSVDVICTDKTGTLTKNEMTVKKMYANSSVFEVEGTGYSTEGRILEDGKEARGLEKLFEIAVLCNDANLNDNVIGDPTEGALLVAAAKYGVDFKSLREKRPRDYEISFDSLRKRMSTVHRDMVCVKGAPEIILSLCDRLLEDGEARKINEEDRKRILEINESFAKNALRVLAFAYKPRNELKSMGDEEIESNLIFTGLIGMIDPPREGVKDAVELCKNAGIRPVMITGDHLLTASAIAKEVGILGKDNTAVESFANDVERVSVYARVKPEHKLNIVDALRKKGHIVAMTGDGVNDAPALKSADIGIAMGITGTDVAKEASDMILQDDNFATIVNAVEHGRGIYDNIKKAVRYLLSCNVGEVLVIFLAILAGLEIPLLAIQILWMNLVTDGLPAIAMSMDEIAKDVMNREPRKPKEGIITRAMIFDIGWISVMETIATLSVFLIVNGSEGIVYARACAFLTLVLVQLCVALSVRYDEHYAFERGYTPTRIMALAFFSSLLLALMVIYVPFLSPIFGTEPLGINDVVIVFFTALLAFGAIELRKVIFRKRKKGSQKGC
ncbi:MAG: calcium-translocating P-type ATPase, PMCA-type [Candidatus Thermoplasmatota archaeon]|nr:calcium-translocating P-type ATPase, PMCA-type [Candidatus Thermoplasmatota archaeon]